MKLNEERKTLNLETDASGPGLGTNLLQLRNGMNCGRGKRPDNMIPWSIAFASKILTSAESWYSNRE